MWQVLQGAIEKQRYTAKEEERIYDKKAHIKK
jgi:hypothetical protein